MAMVSLLINECEGGGERLIASGSVPVVMQVMKKHMEKEKVIEPGCCILWVLSSSTAGQAQLSANGGMPLLLLSMEQHKQSEAIQQLAVMALEEAGWVRR